MAQSKGRTVSLVLGSGGARGLAHVGAIRWLTDNGCDIRSIAGSSIGALVGACYAAGKLDAFAAWVVSFEKLDVLREELIALGRQRAALAFATAAKAAGKRSAEPSATKAVAA